MALSDKARIPSRNLVYSVFLSRQPYKWLCTRFRLSVSVCLCVIRFCKQHITKTNLSIFAKFIADTRYTLHWKWITFGADYIQDGWLKSHFSFNIATADHGGWEALISVLLLYHQFYHGVSPALSHVFRLARAQRCTTFHQNSATVLYSMSPQVKREMIYKNVKILPLYAWFVIKEKRERLKSQSKLLFES